MHIEALSLFMSSRIHPLYKSCDSRELQDYRDEESYDSELALSRDQTRTETQHQTE